MKKVLILLVSVLLLTGCGKATVQTLECSNLNKMMDEGAILIDVRNVTEYDESHLDNAINIEYDTIGDKIGSVVSDKNKTIIVYCRSGKRSSIAANTLIEKGYKHVYDLGAMGNCNS